MKNALKLGVIGLIAGFILIIILNIVLLINGNTAYFLLFNFDYIPIIRDLKPVWFFGYVFHYVTCIVSVIALYYILKIWKWEKRILPYILVYSIGGGALFFLTALSDQLPEYTDFMAWFYWTAAHAVYGYVVGILVKKFMSS